MLRSTDETVTMAVLLLLSGLGSGVDGGVELTVTVFMYSVPGCTSPGMWPVRVNVALAPASIVASVQVTVPVTSLQVKAGPLFCIIDTKVMLPGSVSEKLTFAAALGPAFVITILKGTSLFGRAFAGPLFCANRSADAAPGIVTDAPLELFSSLGSNDWVDEPVATLVKVVPVAASEAMCITKVKLALELSGKLARVQVMMPPDPTAGTELQSKVGPLFWVADTKVIPAGVGSFRETLVASSGPRLIRVTSKETSVSAAAFAGPVLVTKRSA
jgi:hypothetical protein